MKARANAADKSAGLNKRKIIEKAVTDELCAMVDSGGDGKLADLKKGQPNVIMFVGLQGAKLRGLSEANLNMKLRRLWAVLAAWRPRAWNLQHV